MKFIKIFSRGNSPKGGYLLVEMLFYILILTMLLLVIVNILVVLVSSERSIKTSRNIENAAAVSMERMTREIRNATSIDVANSTFGGSPGVLTLNTIDSSGNPESIKFYLSSSVVSLDQYGVYIGPLFPSSVTATSLIFREIDSGKSIAVKIEMTLTAGNGSYAKTASFYSTAILRGSY